MISSLQVWIFRDMTKFVYISWISTFLLYYCIYCFNVCYNSIKKYNNNSNLGIFPSLSLTLFFQIKFSSQIIISWTWLLYNKNLKNNATTNKVVETFPLYFSSIIFENLLYEIHDFWKFCYWKNNILIL